MIQLSLLLAAIPAPADDLVARARAFAIDAHHGQRYGAGRPYSEHLAEVAALARPYGPEVEAVAWLHDVLEDTPTTRGDLAAEFGATIALAVGLCSGEGENRAAKQSHINRNLEPLLREDDGAVEARRGIFTGDRLALIVKPCDRLANARSAWWYRAKLARPEHPAFRAAAYRPGLCDAIWTELEDLLG